MRYIRPYIIIPFILQKIAWSLAYVFFFFYGGVRIYGKKNLKGLSRKVIFASNHVSEFDPILITMCVPFWGKYSPMFYVSAPDKEFKDNKFGIRKFIYGGWFFRAWGAYPLVRGKRNYAVSLRRHIDIVNENNPITIFAYGKIDQISGKVKAHGGAVYIAESSDAVIVPVHISVKKIRKGIFNKRKRIQLTFGRPQKAEDYIDTTEDMTTRYRTAMEGIMNTLG